MPVKTLLNLHNVNEQDLKQAARALIKALPVAYRVVCLEGGMGAGKTTLIRHLCKELEVTDNVSSPTYALVHEYEGKDKLRICHFDFYRINNEQEAEDIGTVEYFESGALCLVEWPSKVINLLPEKYAAIAIQVEESGSRNISLTIQ